MKKTRKLILSCFVIIGLLFLTTPENTFARNVAKGKGKNCTGSCKTCANNVCKSDYKISMKVSEYDRNAGYAGHGKYINSTAPRTITVSVPNKALNNGAVYQIRVFYSKYSTMDSGFFNLKTDLDDAENDDLDDGVKVLKTKIKKGNAKVEKANSAVKVVREDKSNTVTITLNAGYEVVVVAYLNKDVETNSKCTNNKNKKINVTCINGKDIERDDGEESLSGVSASEYVQNPSAVLELANLRGRGKEYGSACNNAYQGVYDSKTATGKENKAADQKYSITDKSALDYYRKKYYPQILGKYYCDKNEVAFNLKESQIAKLSNRALRMFYKSWKLGQKSSSSTGEYSDTYTEVENYVKNLQEKKDANGNKLVETVSNTDISLECKKDVKEGITNKEYLYVKKDDIKTEKLSDGSTPTVCSTICYEHLTVSYDPPVASIAGLCFTYKVTVQSETKCGMKYNKKILEGEENGGGLIGKLQKPMCSPVPICSGNASHTQAGPSLDFDNCIKECDDGEYSQQCINKCYTKIYENNNKTEETNIEKTESNSDIKEHASLNLLVNNNKNNGKILKLGTWTEKELEGYSSSKTAISDCNTTQKVINNISKCAEYFFDAKTLYPKGHYNKSGTSWNSDLSVGEKKDIWNAIGRASPFYVRDEDSTSDLISSILTKDKYNGKVYYIDSNGIKRQYRPGYTCHEACKYTGCTAKNALTPKAFVSSLNVGENDDTSTNKDDMDKIDAALQDCAVTSACETTEETSTFDIKIINPRKADAENEVDKTGTTGLGTTNPTSENITCPDEGDSTENPDPDDVFSMFVPADSDTNTKYGILGLCYDNKTEIPQYKTTITFPGSWINYKSRKIEYDKKNCNSGYELKGGYFCSAYDSTNVNEDWWKWRMEMKDADGNLIYPNFQEPKTKDNIQATAKNFGKYNWNIKYSCFYGIYNGTAECDDCTKLQDYKFKVVDPGVLFTAGSNQKQGYNWTSAARVTENAGVDVSDAKAITYTINPQKYLNHINTNEKDEAIYDNHNTKDDYYIYISSKGIDHIRQKYKDRAYADYNESNFKEDKNVKGLVRYTSTLLRNDLNGYGNNDIYFNPNIDIDGKNNNYADLESLLGN